MRRGAASCRAVLAAVSWWRRSGPRRRCCHREPSWVAEHPRRRDPGEVGPPSGWSPVARMSGRRPGRSLPCPPRPVRDGDVRPTGRADIQRPARPVSKRPGPSRCPDGPASGVRGAAAALSARWIWSGSVWRATPVGRSGSTCPRGLPAAWSPACIGPDGKGRGGGCRCLLAGGSTLAQGRRLAGVPAAAPPGRRADTGWSRARVPAGWGSPGRSRCSPVPPQGVWAVAGVGARPWAWTRRW
jgi:hypothetical protein